jgi:gliding motility-associated-like protein
LSNIDDNNLLIYCQAGNSLVITNESKYIVGKLDLLNKKIDSSKIIGKTLAYSSLFDSPVKASNNTLFTHARTFKGGFGFLKNYSINAIPCTLEDISLSEEFFTLVPAKDSIYLSNFGKGGISDVPFLNLKDISIDEYNNCISCGCPKIESANRDFCQDETFKLPSGKTFVISKDTLLIDTLFNNSGCPNYYKLQTKVLQKKTDFLEKTLCKSTPSIKIASKTYDKAGIYQDTLKLKTGCDSILTIHIKDLSDLSVSLGEDKEILEGDKLMLEAKTNYPDVIKNYVWLPQGTNACDTCRKIDVSPSKNQWYAIKVSKDGCAASDSINVKVLNQKLVYMPNIFSPNDDKINDLYRPYCAEGVAEIEYFQVFDRWGTLIYEVTNHNATDTSIGWDGTYKNIPANRDVYTYAVQVRLRNGQTQRYLGDVFLQRE